MQLHPNEIRVCLIGNQQGLPEISQFGYTELLSLAHLLQCKESFAERVFLFGEVSAEWKLRKQALVPMRRQHLV